MVERQERGGTAERRQFLVHIDADLIRRIKILAIDRGVSASSLVQQALTEFLKHETHPASRTGAPESE
ncbi:CopG family transcriptional regulator [Siccirubricoccus sp. G192]|uniref:ribbon-helix-helix domain-containing protein n=1 Tax=Siccirubricoccus sp. G192 TaxID=2849651 RepID=UPI001C2CAAF6|nr:ribbon-helix-helix domain-containing protein [Siccirubricoccus sp. G192]